MTINNENKPEPRKRITKPKVVVTETVITEEPVTVVEVDETVENSLGIDVLSEKEAIKEAEKSGVSPAVAVSILENRKYIIAGLSAVTVVLIFVVGIIAGLGFAQGMAEDSAHADYGVVAPEEAAVSDMQNTWVDGYKTGFVEGYHASNGGYYGYATDTNGELVPESVPVPSDGVQILPGTVEGQ